MWTVLLLSVALAKPPGKAPKAPPAPPVVEIDKSARWVRDSEEFRLLAEQTYRLAQGAILAQVAALPTSTRWAVIMDADETAIDNVQFQVENVAFTEPAWDAWEARVEAKATPGARAFTDAVHAYGGTIAFVTNRRDPATAKAVLEKNGLFGASDVVCTARRDEAAQKWVSEKKTRRTEVRTGQGACSWGVPVTVLGYFGDQMGDFPESGELAADPLGLSPWGRTYFMLPNPMYGKWEQAPNRTVPW